VYLHIQGKKIYQEKLSIKRQKANKHQQTIVANTRELKAIISRNKKWAKDQNYRAGANNKGSKYTSNKTHYSPATASL